jgi:hypothetical protein
MVAEGYLTHTEVDGMDGDELAEEHASFVRHIERRNRSQEEAQRGIRSR